MQKGSALGRGEMGVGPVSQVKEVWCNQDVVW